MSVGLPSAGRDAGFETFYRSEMTTMVALASSLTGSHDTGAELAQEAMIRAFRHWQRVGELERPGAWLRRVVINLSIDQQRKSQRERRAMHRIEQSTAVDTASPTTHASPDQQFWAAVRALPERQRMVVALRYIDDLGLDDIAAVVGRSVGTVKKLLFVARQTLATTLTMQTMEDSE